MAVEREPTENKGLVTDDSDARPVSAVDLMDNSAEVCGGQVEMDLEEVFVSGSGNSRGRAGAAKATGAAKASAKKTAAKKTAAKKTAAKNLAKKTSAKKNTAKAAKAAKKLAKKAAKKTTKRR